jgi:hypothetical protein
MKATAVKVTASVRAAPSSAAGQGNTRRDGYGRGYE